MTEVSLSDTPVQITTVVSEMFAENAFIIHLNDRNDCIVIDPSFDTEPILQYLTKNELTVSAILNTHGHTDHIVGNKVIKSQFPDAPLVSLRVPSVDSRMNSVLPPAENNIFD